MGSTINMQQRTIPARHTTLVSVAAVTVDGFAIHVGTISTVGSQNLGTEAKLMMVEWSSYKPNYGRAVEIQTGEPVS